MVCGDEPEGECSQVMRDVWLFLDDEMDEHNRALVQQHLDDCSPCLEEAGIDSKLKALLHRKCGGDRAPDYLRERLVAQISEMRISVDGNLVNVDATRITITER